MENKITTRTPVDSVIAAYGVSTSRRLSPLLLLISSVIGSVFFFCLFLWSLHGRITLPPQTVFLGVATPSRIFARLPEAQRDRLPTAWKTQIDTESSWPALFGFSREKETWNFFVIAPRWSLGQQSKEVLPFQRIRAVGSSLPTPATTSTRAVTYLSWLTRTWRHPSAHAQFEIYPDALTTLSSSVAPLTGTLYTTELVTNLRAPTTSPLAPTTTSDVFVRFDTLVTTTMRDIFLQQLHLGHENANTLGFTPTSFQAQYSASGTVDLLSFQTLPMSSSTKVRILGALGFSQKSVQSLPDGSTLIERRLPNEAELQATTTYQTVFGDLTLTDTHLQLNRGENLLSKGPLVSCSKGPLIGRLSEQALQELFKTLDLPFLLAPPGIQFHEQGGLTVLCKE